MIYVAIIGRGENLGVGVAHPKVFTHTDRDELVRKAMAELAVMERGHTSLPQYHIFIGEITSKVIFPAHYKVVDI